MRVIRRVTLCILVRKFIDILLIKNTHGCTTSTCPFGGSVRVQLLFFVHSYM